jgi:hypothetical protein
METREYSSDELLDLAAKVVQAILEDPKLSTVLCERLAALPKETCKGKTHKCTDPFGCSLPFDCPKRHEIVEALS